MLTITDLTFRMEGRVLLDRASAFIPGGHRVGLVGRNGTGKTTLFRILTGELAPDDGGFSLPRGVRIGMVRQEAPAGPISLIDTVLAADKERAALLKEAETASDPLRIAEIQTRLADIGAHSAPARAAVILKGLGFDDEAQLRPCAEFSGGWRMRVALAAVLFSQPDLLLLDEPTNYLDLEGTIWLEDFLKNYPATVLLISHDRDLLNRAVGAILHLDQRKLTFYAGGYDRFEEARAQKLMLQEAARKKQEAQRKHMQEFVDRFRYKASKARQAQSRLKALSRMSPIAAVLEDRVKPFLLPSPPPLAPPILALDQVAAGYDDGPDILCDISLRIDQDDRIALLGANGNGKSTFAKLISGRLAPRRGTLLRAPKMRIGFFAQHQLDELVPNESPFQHLQQVMPGATQTQIRAKLGAFGFGADLADTEARKLSGGEKARLLFALAAHDAPHLLILDEPTNHLDVDSREALVVALNEYEGAVLLISHDRHLIEASADRLWLVKNGRVAAFDGDLEDYKRILLGKAPAPAERADTAIDEDKVSRAEERRAAAERRAQLAPLKKRADAAEKEYVKVSAELGRVDAALADPSLYARDPGETAALSKKRGELKRLLAAIEADWLEAQDAYERAAAS
ncbi:MAG: ABC-F family ATP-binding cassette domain-containing protein [Alphaproteobacteria bacterium]|nr:ABC-F family ATP-binding cassette domain-containing protein [Alphaproteobacteria bacterium]